jgi:hypothetical protein
MVYQIQRDLLALQKPKVFYFLYHCYSLERAEAAIFSLAFPLEVACLQFLLLQSSNFKFFKAPALFFYFEPIYFLLEKLFEAKPVFHVVMFLSVLLPTAAKF